MDTKPQCGKGWADRCENSRGRSCRCRCGGRNHGRARGLAPVGEDRPKLTNPKVFDRPLERALNWNADGVADIVLWRDGDPDKVGNARASIPQRLVVHSPTGFEWGYGGSGPADLALNILARFTTPQDAWSLHQDFKRDVVAALPREGGTITGDEVRAWLAAKFRESTPFGYSLRESRTTSA